MKKAQALQALWSSYGLEAYDRYTVPPGAVMPYITYDGTTDSFDSTVSLSTSLWYYSTSWAEIAEKAEQIATDIGMSGKLIHYEGGAMWVTRGQPFAQRMNDPEDNNIRRILLTVNVEYLTEN